MEGKAKEMLLVWKASWISQLIHFLASDRMIVKAMDRKMISLLVVFHQLRFWGQMSWVIS